MYQVTAALAATLIAFGGASAAQTTLTFDKIDTQEPYGVLDLSELEAAFNDGQAVLDKYDDNEDGQLTAYEISGEGKPETGDAVTFAELDTNQDGVLDEEELADVFGGNANVALAKFDQNGDGYVTKDEVRSSDDPVGERGKHKWGEAGPGASADAKTSKADRASPAGGIGEGKGGDKGHGQGGGKGKGPKG